ncbi:TetR family transcriptional regulator [Streptomyces sp. NBC_01267]|uniref:TetR/AcrR family transcriptional regulator n=1 Tax=Streptomyces sp. NBC_01267 TaxID=2903805 RepID=UPI002E33DDB3|nr:TetR/AcrR family transcriptional regulator [Streptomyces sp. NBC_01267]
MAGAAAQRHSARGGEELRVRIVREATTVIAEEGLATLTMSALAKRLNTSGGHLLYYFDSKDRLLLEALRYSENALTEERRALLRKRVTPRRRLDLFLQLYLPTGPRDPRWMLWIELWARTGSDEALRPAQEEMDAAWQQDLRSILLKGVERAEFAPADVTEQASQLLALLDGLSTRVVLGQGGTDSRQALATARAAAVLLVPGAGPRHGE